MLDEMVVSNRKARLRTASLLGKDKQQNAFSPDKVADATV